MRYKKPNRTKSIKLEKVISSNKSKMKPDVQFASSVALFGMLLRKSQFVQDGSYSQVIKLAKETKKNDDSGYRSEFIELVKIAQELDQPPLSYNN